MRCLDEIDALIAGYRNGWIVGEKALLTLRAQIVLDVAKAKQDLVAQAIKEASLPIPGAEIE